MELEELKKSLEIPLDDTSKDAVLGISLVRAIDFAKTYCKNDFANGLPEGIKEGITLLVKGRVDKRITQSQALGDMSKQFFPPSDLDDAKYYFEPFKKVKFL